MDGVVYVVEEYMHWDSSNILAAYSDRKTAIQKVEAFLAGKKEVFTKNPCADEWSSGRGVSYLINETPLNQDIAD